MDVRGGKTGFINQAGYCLATLLKLPQGNQVAVVVLGASNNMLRFMETRHIFNWLNEKTPGVVTAKPPAPSKTNRRSAALKGCPQAEALRYSVYARYPSLNRRASSGRSRRSLPTP